MDAITVSAKFAAYTWFTEAVGRKRNSQDDAARFTEENWEHFLDHADKGLGRLLLRLHRTRSARIKGKREEAA